MKQKKLILAALIVVILAAAVGGTVAFLTTSTEAVTNTFVPQQVTCEIHEIFYGVEKSDITVKNTCDIPVYIRVALIPYWQDADGNVAGIASWTPNFTPENGWFKGNDGYYYYPNAIEPDASTLSLTSGLTLPPDDSYKAALTIAAEAIQAEGGAVKVSDSAGWTITNPQ